MARAKQLLLSLFLSYPHPFSSLFAFLFIHSPALIPSDIPFSFQLQPLALKDILYIPCLAPPWLRIEYPAVEPSIAPA